MLTAVGHVHGSLLLLLKDMHMLCRNKQRLYDS